MRLFRVLTVPFFIVAAAGSAFAQDLKLWYRQPAANWNEGLPVGNGRLAAMVFGNPAKERLQLNEETVWAGGPGNNIPNTNFKASLPEVRRLLFEGKYEEAQALAMRMAPREAGPTNNYGMPYQTVGNLYIDFPSHKGATNYRRELDLANAITTTKYTVGKVTYTREVLVSFTDNVIAVHLTAS
ncbi:MAG TPA: glycoside hydrolase family 95 protein, partial [Cyclobacteriaceae bacterium]